MARLTGVLQSVRSATALAASAIALLGMASVAGAEEAPASDLTRDGPKIVDYLKGQQASLFDLSLVRLDARLAAVGNAHKFWAYASYQDGRIQIYAYDDARPAKPASCKQILDAIRSDAGIDLASGYPFDPASGYASLFSYPRIREIDVSDTYMETVDSILSVKVVIGQTGDGKGLVCDTPLLGKDFTHKAE